MFWNILFILLDFFVTGDRSKLDSNALESHEYVMKIVPTTYEDLHGTKLVAYQYTYAYRSYISFGHGGRVIPALWFRYTSLPSILKLTKKNGKM